MFNFVFSNKFNLYLVSGCYRETGLFECYTGDSQIMRRKVCPSFGAGFSDLCYKKVPGKYNAL